MGVRHHVYPDGRRVYVPVANNGPVVAQNRGIQFGWEPGHAEQPEGTKAGAQGAAQGREANPPLGSRVPVRVARVRGSSAKGRAENEHDGNKSQRGKCDGRKGQRDPQAGVLFGCWICDQEWGPAGDDTRSEEVQHAPTTHGAWTKNSGWGSWIESG